MSSQRFTEGGEWGDLLLYIHLLSQTTKTRGLRTMEAKDVSTVHALVNKVSLDLDVKLQKPILNSFFAGQVLGEI